MSLWNEFNLHQPPLTTLPIKNSKLCLTEFHKILDNALKFYENQEEFEEAAALCSRLIVRRKNSFKKMSGFKEMCKLNAALCRVLRIDIQEILKNFIGLLPDYMSVIGSTELPSRANLEYVLIRLISLHNLFKRIVNCTLAASIYFIKLLHMNFFQEIITLYTAILAQIWKESHLILEYTSEFYQKLLQYKFELPLANTKQQWSEDNFCFPQSLDEIKISPDEEISIENKLTDKDEPTTSFKIEKAATVHQKLTKEFENLYKDVDIGTIIKRELTPASKKSEKVENINNVEDIRKFLDNEDKQRRQSLKQSKTKNISHAEWSQFKKNINNKISSGNIKNKNIVNYFKKFLQNKKIFIK